MLAFELFRHCPRCGSSLEPGANPLRCRTCGLVYFVNPTVAAAAIIFDPHGRVVLIRRNKDPRQGFWTVPGGFLDIGESAETGLIREVREEVGMDIDEVNYLCSEPNRYLFREVTYPVCDLIFTARAIFPDQAAALDGADDFAWRYPHEIDLTEIAFPSVQKGLRLLRNREV